jgi:hypothetical protein
MRKAGVIIAGACLLCAGCYRGSPVRLELEQPAPSFPYNGMSLVPDTLTLRWNPSAWATSYSVQVSMDFDFTAIVDSAVCTAPLLAITVPLLNSATYFWRVSSSDGQERSDWSAVFSFTTGVAAPALLSPEDNAIWIPETLTLAWSASAGDSQYYIQVSTDAGFSSSAIDDSTGAAFYTVPSPLVPSTPYFWRVSVLRRQGRSGWSEPYTFTTVDSLPAPVLVHPAAGAAGVSSADSLVWDTIPSQWASYHVQVSTVSDFSAGLAVDTTVMASALPLAALTPSTLYYWRAASRLFLAGFMDRQGGWSAARSFTTQ